MKRTREASAIKKILVPTDFSPSSKHAINYAATLARKFAAQIVLIHVIESLPYSVTDTFTLVDHRRALEKTAGSLLENSRKELVRKGLSVKAHLLSGAPSREILQRARREKADLIVMGTQGRTGVSRLLLGSVAEKVVRLSACSVLTVRNRTAIPARSAERPSVTLYG